MKLITKEKSPPRTASPTGAEAVQIVQQMQQKRPQMSSIVRICPLIDTTR